MKRHLSIVALVVPVGCQGAREPTSPATCALTAAPAGSPVLGDANGDGHLDLSDGMYLARHSFMGGPAPACAMAADVLTNEELDAGDGFAIWSYLFGGGTSTVETDGTECAAFTRQIEPACAEGLALGIRADATVSGAGTVTFPAAVTLTSPTLPAEGWSFGIAAEGCTLTAATTVGTVAADLHPRPTAGPPGLRDRGYSWIAPTLDASAVVLSYTRPVTHTGAAAVDVLLLDVSAPVGAACAACTLTVVSDRPGANVPIEAIVSGGGYRYTPALSSATIEVCPG